MEFTLFMLRWLHFLAVLRGLEFFTISILFRRRFFAETEAAVRMGAIQKLVPRALWWFRWGAMFTFLAGISMYIAKMSEMGRGGFSIHHLMASSLPSAACSVP